MTKPRCTNYFKSVRNQFFPFADNVPESIRAAYDSALKEDPSPAVYRPTVHPGPWDSSPIIGHRSRADILRELNNAGDDDQEISRLHDELSALHTVFLNSGRTVPLAAVA